MFYNEWLDKVYILMNKEKKIFNGLDFVDCLTILLITIFIFSIGTVNNNCAEANNLILDTGATKSNAFEAEELPYTFKIADKLEGNGGVKLKLDKNQIEGFANGKGKTTKCDVDFFTNIMGAFGSFKGIDVTINGTGVPVGVLVPGKISFYGPLKGSFQNGKIVLAGDVHIKGFLARCAGFRDIENISIEIPYSSITKTVLNLQKMHRQDNLSLNSHKNLKL